MKKLWEYIKSNNLQNPANRQEILCDDRLRALFGCDKVKMFGMNKVGPLPGDTNYRFSPIICGLKQMLWAATLRARSRNLQ